MEAIGKVATGIVSLPTKVEASGLQRRTTDLEKMNRELRDELAILKVRNEPDDAALAADLAQVISGIRYENELLMAAFVEIQSLSPALPHWEFEREVKRIVGTALAELQSAERRRD